MAMKVGLSGAMLGAVAGAVAVAVGVVGWQARDIGQNQSSGTGAGPQALATLTENRTADQAAPQATSDASAAARTQDPAGKASPAAPRFDTFRLSNDGNAVVAGMAPGARRVVIVMDGVDVTATDVAANGGFAAVFDIAPAQVPRMMTLRAEYADGTDQVSTETIAVAPVVMAPVAVASDSGAAPTDALAAPDTPATVAAESQAIAQPASLLISDGRVKVLRPNVDGALTIDTIAYAPSGAVEVAGRGDSGQVVRLYLDNQLQFETPISGQGDWDGALPDVAPGLYALRADVLDASGKVTARSETPFLREAPEALQSNSDVPALQLVTVQPGYTLWGIAEQTYGQGQNYVTVFEANRAQIRNPDLIYPGQIFTLPKGVN